MFLNAMAAIKKEGLARSVYFRQGYEINGTLQAILDWQFGQHKREAKVLDFACGYGRATRFLVAEVGPTNVWASDIYADAVEFQERQFGVHGFVSCYEPSKLECEQKFDLIFVASLFTHLPQHRFEQWLARLFDMLSETGFLAFSVHDETLAAGRTMPADGFLFREASESRSLDLAEYGSTYVTENYLSSAISRVVAGNWPYKRIPLALCGAHDLYLVPRDRQQDFTSLRYVQPPVGYLERFSMSVDGVLNMAGWAGEHDAAQSLEHIAILVDGEVVKTLEPTWERPDVVHVLGKENFLLSGWEVLIPNMGGSMHAAQTVEVVVESTSGKKAVLHSSLVSEASAEVPFHAPAANSPAARVR